MLQMVHCSQYLSKKKEREHLDYGEVAYEACANSFNSLRKYRNLAKLACVLCVYGCTYERGVDEQTNFHGSETAWMLIIFLPVVLLNFIRTLKAIAVISMIGNVLMIGAFVFILQHLLRADHVTSRLPWFTDFNGVMTACGSIMCYPWKQAEKTRRHDRSLRSVVSGVSLVSVVYAGSGLFGYITYGSDVKGSITLNLPQNCQLYLCFCQTDADFGRLLRFCIQQYVIVEMLWPSVRTKIGKIALLSKQGCDLPLELVFRAGLVTIAMLIALAVPNLEEIIPLVGITAGMLLAFIPSLMDTMTFLPVLLEKSKQTSRWSIYARIFRTACWL
uniref:Amino acid transporter transmembrane domain-containing protein n=1 Tax=Ditylenchus dipsaci TaxID=166011 RepID=A0A915CRG1_9BILA